MLKAGDSYRTVADIFGQLRLGNASSNRVCDSRKTSAGPFSRDHRRQLPFGARS
jgi:hypothetical protein